MSLKRNIIYSAILQSANYIFQFITFPYASRILEPDGIGLYNFVTNIVHYFMLFSAMGVINLGTREIAKCQSQEQRDIVFSNILFTNGIITLGVLLLYIPLIFIIPDFSKIKSYLLIGVVQIIFNAFTIEWLFRGIQNFKFITNRSIAIRCIYVIAVFVFVRDKDDVMTYYLLSVFTIVANGIINWGYSRKIAHLVKIDYRDALRRYTKPIFLLGAQALISFFYVGFNTVYLGMVSNDAEVGYFSTATKIIIIILALYTAYSTALMPKMSSIVATGDKKQENYLIHSSIQLLCCFSLPLIGILMTYPDLIISIIAGDQYFESIRILTIGAPIIIVLGLNQILFIQILIPKRQDKSVALNCLYGAITGILLNLVLVGYYKLNSIGSIITWITAESIVMITTMNSLRRLIKIREILRNILKVGMLYSPLFFILWILHSTVSNIYISFSISMIILILYCHIIMKYALRQPQYNSIITKLRIRL